eukprot:3966524-Pleurochrysis_carterae.AAC.2
MGAPADIIDARISSMLMLRIARLATPLSWCTCGGQVVESMQRDWRKAGNSADRSSPASSLWKDPRD